MYTIKCAHCGTINDDEGNCSSCGAALPIPIKRFETRTIVVRADRLHDARQILAQCGFEEVSCLKMRGMFELKLQRNTSIPSYSKIVDISNEVIRDLQPELPRKRYGGFLAFFIVFMVLCACFLIPTLVLYLVGTGIGDQGTLNTSMGFLITSGSLAGVGFLFMFLMIGRINSYKRNMTTYKTALADVRAKADACQKIILALDER